MSPTKASPKKSSPKKRLADEPKEVPEETTDVGEVKDEEATASMPDTAAASGAEENYLDDSPHQSQTSSNKTSKAGTAKPEASASTGEKRQRSIAEMFGGSKKARASTPPGVRRAAMASSSPGGADAGASKAPAKRTINGLPVLKYIPFSLSEFQNSLTERQKELLQLECDTFGLSWFKILKDEFKKPYFIKLKEFLWEEGIQGKDKPCPKVYPPAADIYAWSRYTPLGKVKVVIIGQDPYHGPKQAHGLCFSVRPGVAVPPSLKNMYTEIKNTYPGFVPPKHGSLVSWANSGVLLLNTSLTVKAGQAGSHANKGWETFTEAVVKAVDKYGGANLPNGNGVGKGVVFLAWGSWAAKRVAGLDKKKHCILTSAHPSPLSAHRGFLGNGHFKKANDWLEQKYGIESKVDWCTLDENAIKEGDSA
ncbi:Uracil DNA glycosylase superfamily [Ceratobasidium sp. AG-Ba]|nr:Uracil DNA glycosylase superfamily [Ceratobasidium sp. AG-Ba]QRW12836.1 Uracil DNA glycosylase superfamily [Ceratobasidium sp. AG-Ba]